MGLCNIENVIRHVRLRWCGHLGHMDSGAWQRKVNKTIVTGSNENSWNV